MNNKWIGILIITILAVVLLAGCSLFNAAEDGKIDGTPDPYPLKEIQLEGTGNTEIYIGPGGLSEEAEVKIEDLGAGEPFGEASPFSPASVEYYLDLGEANQIGEITMTVPLSSAAKLSAPASSGLVYLTWVQPEKGYPSVVGTKVEDNLATFPAVGAGKYQVFSLKSHAALLELISIYDPLSVPSYPQMTPAWCSPTAMTNLAQFHQGAWPSGGIGSVWGESSNWYLAGNAGQAYSEGRFFHQVLGAGGYTVPEDVKLSFSDANAEVIIWNWVALVDSGFSNPAFADILFNSFRSYVEHYLWGIWGDRRPVAWGSSLAGHSRTITGSDGDNFYFNNPSSGSYNQSILWEDYRQDVIDSLTAEKIEVIDTVVFHAPPRPAAERKAVLWLLPRTDYDNYEGSVAMISGETGNPAAAWYWHGGGTHSLGYYYIPINTNLPQDPLFHVAFKASHIADKVQYGFLIRSISQNTYDFSVIVGLYNEDMSVNRTVGVFAGSVGPGNKMDFRPAGDIDLVGLPEGVYTFKFYLVQDGILQDVKYVQFLVEKPDKLFLDPHAIVQMPAFCRLGPSTEYPALMVFDEGDAVGLLGTNPGRTWGKVEKQVDGHLIRCWISFAVVDPVGEESVPLAEFPPVPEEQKETPSFSCSRYKSEEPCMSDSRCNWVFGLGPGYCTAK